MKAAPSLRSHRSWKFGLGLTTLVALSSCGHGASESVTPPSSRSTPTSSQRSTVAIGAPSATQVDTLAPSTQAPGRGVVPDTGGASVVSGEADVTNSVAMAIDLATGRVRWSIAASDDLRGVAEAAADNEHVYLRSGFCDNNVATALDSTTGAIVWRSPPDLPIVEASVDVADPLLAASETVVMQAVGTSGQFGIVGLDTATGIPRWRSDGGRVIAESENVVVVWSPVEGQVRVLDRLAGTERWSRRTGPPLQVPNTGPPTSKDLPQPVAGAADTDLVFLRIGDEVSASEISTGSTHWTVSVPHMQDPAQLHAGPGVVLTESEGGILALDANDGSKRWFMPKTTDVDYLSLSGAQIVGGNLFFAESSLSVVDMNTGDPGWKIPSGIGPAFLVAAGNGRVLIGDQGGHIHLFDAATGDDQWKSLTDDGIPAPAGSTYVLGPDALYIARVCGGA